MLMVPEPIVWLGIATLCVMIHFLTGVYMLRHRHKDTAYNRYVEEAISQGLSPEDATKAVSMHFVLENYLWPKIKWDTSWKYKFKR